MNDNPNPDEDSEENSHNGQPKYAPVAQRYWDPRCQQRDEMGSAPSWRQVPGGERGSTREANPGHPLVGACLSANVRLRPSYYNVGIVLFISWEIKSQARQQVRRSSTRPIPPPNPPTRRVFFLPFLLHHRQSHLQFQASFARRPLFLPFHTHVEFQSIPHSVPLINPRIINFCQQQ